MLIPYRAKNPPERRPYVTLGLIAANALIYIPTSVYLLYIRESAVDAFAVTHNNANPLRILTAAFMHHDPLHLIGNMLFLWIFGAALEGRLGHIKFLLLYLAAAFGSWFLHDMTFGLLHPKLPLIGASGAIMGLAGAYLFVFPFAAIVCAWLFGGIVTFRGGVSDIQARWVVLYFLGFDILYGLLFQGLDGTAHFAHIGGAATGILVAFLMRPKRDSEDYASAQAMRADVGGHLMSLSLPELESLMESTDDANVVVAFCRKAQTHPSGQGYNMAANAVRRHAALLLEKADAEEVARLVLLMPQTVAPMPTGWLLRLTSKLESEGAYQTTADLYQRIAMYSLPPADSEMILVRLARLLEQMGDKIGAANVLNDLLRRFPNGAASVNARASLARLNVPIPAAAPPPGGLATVTPRETPAALAPMPNDEPNYRPGTAGMSLLSPIGGQLPPSDTNAG